MSEAIRTIHLPSATAFAAVVQRVRAALVPWAAEWMIGGAAESSLPNIDASSLGRDSTRDTDEFDCVRTQSGTIWFRRTAADLATLGRAVVGPDLMPQGTCADEAVADVLEHAWSARNRAIVAALVNAVPENSRGRGALPASLFELGSGAARFSCEPLGLNCVADHSIWRSIPPSDRARGARPKLTPLDAAVKQPTARIEVVLGAVELDLANVFDLRSGDVLRLPQRLDEGLSVLCEGHPFTRGALGERDGRVCVQLTDRPDIF